ncbi:lipopolysaccharide biosynthesis protein [Paenibacillus glycinis]|uniref:Oligosaccharide flippase family protein n=1 Tax=Paenibacillus glycinis TaxID=2697035 RepID=A0ABW9XP46_9BACL|nr:oligosaccharide flippase family protein [Paenibacillus glycinis]NBD24206.1 oligosaccharide flippase family protein [Paenibacillus glycinis]
MDKLLRNILLLASGTAISQVIILATLPILTRMYTPSDYGAYAVYTSIVSILLVLVSLSYENAIALPEDDRTASNVLSLSLRICVVVSVISGIGIVLLSGPLSKWLGEPGLGKYAFYIVLSLLGTGFYQILNFWSVRKKYFKPLSRTKLTQSIGQVTAQLGLFFANLGPIGLIVGDIIGRFGGLIPQWRLWRSDVKAQALATNWEDLKESAYRYRRFPLLSTGSNVLNSIGLYLPTILLAAFYGPQVAGCFALGQRILGSPMTLIMTSVRQVYLSESSDHMNHNPDKLYRLFRKTVINMFLFGLVVIAVFFIFAPSLFTYLLGSTWAQAGVFLRILSIMYLSQFVANSVGTTIDVMERQDLHLFREIVRTILILGSLLAAHYTHRSSEVAIWIFSMAATLGYVLHLGLSWTAVKRYKGNPVTAAHSAASPES